MAGWLLCAVQIGGEIAAAVGRASEPAAKAAAGAAAFDSQLDVVVRLGWAYVERFCHENLLQVGNKGSKPGKGIVGVSGCVVGVGKCR